MPVPVNVRLGGLDIELPVFGATVNVLVILAAALKPHVPVQVSKSPACILRFVVAAVAVFKTIFPEPKLIERDRFEIVELNVDVVKVKLFKTKLAAYKLVLPTTVIALLRVVVVPLVYVKLEPIDKLAIVLPLAFMLPVPRAAINKFV